MSENIEKSTVGKAAPAGKKSERPATNKPKPAIVSCTPQSGWCIVEGLL